MRPSLADSSRPDIASSPGIPARAPAVASPFRSIGALTVRLMVGFTVLATGVQAAPEPESPALPASAPTGAGSVAMRVVTDARTIAPGESFLAGVELTLDPGWHVYWKNPGDAGLSTELAFDLPEGFTVGPVRYPVPQRFEQPGQIVGYGYADRVLLFAEITAPSALEPGTTIEMGVSCDWLSCAHVCIPGRATQTTTLEVAETASRTGDAARWLASLPSGVDGKRPLAHEVAGTRSGPSSASYSIEVVWASDAPSTIEWIPDTPDVLEIENLSVDTSGRTTRITFDAALLAGADLDRESMETVVAYLSPDGERQGAVVPVGLEMLAPAPN